MTERRVPVGGVRLWVANSGNGSGVPAMLCSGGPGCCDYLAPVAEMIDDLGPVWRFEQRGCGRSDPEPPYDVETCVADLDAIRAALGLDSWVIGGHSWGANLALAYALECPDRVDALVYISGSGAQNDREWSATYHARKEERGEREPDYEFSPNLEVNRVGNESWRRYIKHPAFWRRVADLDVPALFVVAPRDIRPNWPAAQLAAAIPRARLAEIEDAEHAIWLSGDAPAAALRSELRTFIAGL